MFDKSSRTFEAIIADLERKRNALTDRRRNYTRNLVTQTNEEARSGIPYVVEAAQIIAQVNGAELFIDGLINSLISDGRNLGEGAAMKRALGSVLKQVKHLEPGDRSGYVAAADLQEISTFLLESLSSVELRELDS